MLRIPVKVIINRKLRFRLFIWLCMCVCKSQKVEWRGVYPESSPNEHPTSQTSIFFPCEEKIKVRQISEQSGKGMLVKYLTAPPPRNLTLFYLNRYVSCSGWQGILCHNKKGFSTWSPHQLRGNSIMYKCWILDIFEVKFDKINIKLMDLSVKWSKFTLMTGLLITVT